MDDTGGELPDTLRLVCVTCCLFRPFIKHGVPHKDGTRIWQTYRCSQCEGSAHVESSVDAERGSEPEDEPGYNRGYAVGYECGVIESAKKRQLEAWDAGWRAATRFLRQNARRKEHQRAGWHSVCGRSGDSTGDCRCLDGGMGMALPEDVEPPGRAE